MHVADIEYTLDGTRLVGQLAVDDSRDGRRPAVLVAHDAGGLDDHAKRSACKLAELGYVAFALDYYGSGERLAPDQVGARFGELAADVPRIRAMARAGLDGEMRAGGVDWQMHLYGGAVHSFTNPIADGSNPAIRYDQRADERSWRAMRDLFDEVF